jgi:hypothetical protein
VADVAQKRNSGSVMASTVVATGTHALIPVFWLFSALFIMPRYHVQIAELGIEELPGRVDFLFAGSQFMAVHSFVFLFLVVITLAADGAVYYLLLRSSKAMAARLWSLSIVIAEITISLLLYLPLRSAVESMAS